MNFLINVKYSNIIHYAYNFEYNIDVNYCRISYLAIKSALMCEADYLFIREWPQKLIWPEILCEHVLMVSIIF